MRLHQTCLSPKYKFLTSDQIQNKASLSAQASSVCTQCPLGELTYPQAPALLPSPLQSLLLLSPGRRPLPSLELTFSLPFFRHPWGTLRCPVPSVFPHHGLKTSLPDPGPANICCFGADTLKADKSSLIFLSLEKRCASGMVCPLPNSSRNLFPKLDH